jgi:hypothetical protein
MTDGAILVGDNVIYEDWFSEILTIGTWTNDERLLEEQLEPAAEFAGGEETGLEIRSTAPPDSGYNALALLGTDIGISGLRSNYAISVDYWIGDWWPMLDYQVYEISAPGSPRSLVILFGEYFSNQRFRVRWHAPGPGRLGHVVLGRAMVSVDLVDRGWSLAYPDQAKRVASEGGQIYTSSPQVVREMTISAGSMGDRSAFGVQRIVKKLDLPAPNLSGDVTLSDGWLTANESEQGAAEWPNLMEIGKHYRIDFHQQWRMDTPVEGAPSAPGAPRWSISSSSLYTGPDQGFPTGRASVYGEADQSDTLVWACTSGDGRAKVKVLAVYEVDFELAGWGFLSELANIQAFYARHGNSRPVVALVRPSDPILNKATGIYGYMTGKNELRQRGDADGDLFSTGIRITEAR